MAWESIIRNFDNIQFETIRRTIDPKFNDIHDELSSCYYNKKPFREYGILDKSTFSKLHSLIFYLRDIEFHNENMKLPLGSRIPEDIYNNDGMGNSKVNIALEELEKLRLDGIEIKM